MAQPVVAPGEPAPSVAAAARPTDGGWTPESWADWVDHASGLAGAALNLARHAHLTVVAGGRWELQLSPKYQMLAGGQALPQLQQHVHRHGHVAEQHDRDEPAGAGQRTADQCCAHMGKEAQGLLRRGAAAAVEAAAQAAQPRPNTYPMGIPVIPPTVQFSAPAAAEQMPGQQDVQTRRDTERQS